MKILNFCNIIYVEIIFFIGDVINLRASVKPFGLSSSFGLICNAETSRIVCAFFFHYESTEKIIPRFLKKSADNFYRSVLMNKMKKMVFGFCMVLILFAQPVFAAPSDEEVANTIEDVLQVYGLTMVAAMFGAGSDAVSVKNDMATGKIIATYKNYSAKGAVNSMNQFSQDKENKLDISFDYMSGTITVVGDMSDMGGDERPNDLLIDVSLKGGNIKTLWLKAKENSKNADNPYIELKINGRPHKNPQSVWNKISAKN